MNEEETEINNLCDYTEENNNIVKAFVNSVKMHGDMETLKEVKTALLDFNLEQNHRFDPIVSDLSQWMIKITHEHRVNIFNGAVGAVDCNVDRQMFIKSTRKEIKDD